MLLILNRQISRNNYYAFLWHAVFLALATNFMDVDTIIPAMMVDAGGSPLHLGILTAIMLGGGRLAQLFFAPFLSNRSAKKGYLLTGINSRILALGGMAVLFYFSSNIGGGYIIFSIFLLISLFSFSGAFANINYVDIMGKSVLQEKRKAFFSVKQIISSIVVFLSAFLAREILTVYSYPMNYSMLFLLAAVLLGTASLGFWKIKEISAPNFRISGFTKYLNVIYSEIRTNKKLRNYLLLINTQGISIVLMPFLILYAKNMLSAGSRDVGNFLVLKVVGGVLTGSILFYYSKKIKYRVMLYTTSVIAIIIPLLILILPGQPIFPYIFLAGGIVFTIHRIAMSGVLLEITSNHNRALYTGLSGAGGILPVLFPFLGGWIVERYGFDLFFVIFMVVVIISLYFIYKLDCKR